MIIIDNDNYYKLSGHLKQVTISHLFARSVIDQMVDGRVYVDDEDNPATFYVVHPYGMSLLFGDADNEDFNSKFLDYALNTPGVRGKPEWLQAFPDSWNDRLRALIGDKLVKAAGSPLKHKGPAIEEHTRVNFKFDPEKYAGLKSTMSSHNDYTVVRTDEKMFANIAGSVVPKEFWNNAADFFNHGIGYSLLYDNIVASTAYSSFIFEDELELGIETNEKFRGKGFALYTCSALIDYCIANGYEPVWSCRLENTGSYKLAQKLGFEPTLFIPYYKLNT